MSTTTGSVCLWAPGGALGWSLAAIALPKCPACIVGWLSLVGVGVGVGGVAAALVRPTVLIMAVLATALTLVGLVRPYQRPLAHPGRRN